MITDHNIKSVHLSTWDNEGGAARATFRLHNALQRAGVDGRMLVLHRITDSPSVSSVAKNYFQKVMEKGCGSIDNLPTIFWKHDPRQRVWSPGWIDLFRVHLHEDVRTADVITLFWVCGGFLSAKAIGRLLRLNKPLMWRLSDMWPFTGGCHYSGQCTRYEEKCGRCPQLGSNHDYDLSKWVWNRKYAWWKDYSITIVCPSRWIAACAQRSSLFRNQRIEIIPSGIDLKVFNPIDKKLARLILNLPLDVPLILFGASNAMDDPRKGKNKLEAALEILASGLSVNSLPQLVLFGSWNRPRIKGWGAPIHVLGHVYDEPSLALLFSACDIFIAPSLEDNLPNTVLESLACGTPVVAFNIGGIPDIIEHKKNGYLAKAYDPEDLARGIEWILSDEKRHRDLSREARLRVERDFDITLIARKYLALYQDVLTSK